MNKLILALAGAAITIATPACAQGPEFASALEFSPFMVAISVDDMAAETAFFVDVLDFRIERDASMRDGAVQFRWLTNGTQRIELVKAAGSVLGTAHPAPPGHAGVRGFTHVTLQTNDIAAVRNVLATRGIVPVMEPTDVAVLGVRVMYLVDPEGNAVEIAQVVGG
jgi:catechol 2,3-dioxygenase-like lactoylglutathione lyase family enzyme